MGFRGGSQFRWLTHTDRLGGLEDVVDDTSRVTWTRVQVHGVLQQVADYQPFSMEVIPAGQRDDSARSLMW